MSDDPVALMRLAHFFDLVGRSVDVDFGSGPVAAEVLSATALTQPTIRPGGGFSVLLRVPHERPQQGVFAVQHPTLGTMDLLLCPRRVEGGLAYFELLLN